MVIQQHGAELQCIVRRKLTPIHRCLNSVNINIYICPYRATFGKQFCPSGESCLPMLRKQLSHVGQAPCPQKYIFILSITYNFIPPTQLWKTLLITVLISCTLSTAKTEIKNPCGYPQAYKQLLENFSTKKEQQKI